MKSKLFLILLTTSLFANTIIIKNAQIFDGEHNKLIRNKDILIKDELIVKIAKDIKKENNTIIIDAKNQVLIPGLIDAHIHLMVVDNFEDAIYKDDQSYIAALATKAAERMLLRGFTTIRDAGGPVSGIKEAIDTKYVKGPRIFPSNAFISQTSGHGDFSTSKTYLSPYFIKIPDKSELYGWVKIADGVAEVQKAAREVLRSGASQLKVMISGSVTGAHDPLDVQEYTYAELKAIVDEAEKWGTYVMVHAYTDKSVRMAIKAGVKSIEHGLMLKPETLKLMKEKDIWLSTQCFGFSKTAKEVGFAGTHAEAKYNQVKKNAVQVYKLAKKYNLKVAWGTDLFGAPEYLDAQSQEFISRAKYFSSFEVLRQATGDNAKLLALSGKRSPYNKGTLGVIKKGAYADLLIVKGNPLKDVTLLANPKKNILFILKGGEIYKNTL